MALVQTMGLVIDQFLLVFLIHDKDAGLPFQVGAGYANADVGNEGGVAGWHTCMYCSDHGPSVALIAPSSG